MESSPRLVSSDCDFRLARPHLVLDLGAAMLAGLDDDLAAGLFDLLFGLGAELVRVNLELAVEIAVAEDLDLVVSMLGEAARFKEVHRHVGASVELRKIADVDDRDFQSKRVVVEAALGQPAKERHL